MYVCTCTHFNLFFVLIYDPFCKETIQNSVELKQSHFVSYKKFFLLDPNRKTCREERPSLTILQCALHPCKGESS